MMPRVRRRAAVAMLWAGVAVAQHAQAQAPAPDPAPVDATKPAAAAPPAAAKTPQSEAGEPRATTSPVTSSPSTSPRAKGAATGRDAPKPNDRVDLDTTTITGNRELPKVMYVVPWKKSDIGDVIGKPMNSLLDEVLAPVDRDVFRREVRYYDAVKADSNQNGAPAAGPANKVEK